MILTTKVIPTLPDHEMSFLDCLVSDNNPKCSQTSVSMLGTDDTSYLRQIQSILGPWMHGTNCCSAIWRLPEWTSVCDCSSCKVDWSFILFDLVIVFYFCRALDNLISDQNQHSLHLYGWNCLLSLQRANSVPNVVSWKESLSRASCQKPFVQSVVMMITASANRCVMLSNVLENQGSHITATLRLVGSKQILIPVCQACHCLQLWHVMPFGISVAGYVFKRKFDTIIGNLSQVAFCKLLYTTCNNNTKLNYDKLQNKQTQVLSLVKHSPLIIINQVLTRWKQLPVCHNQSIRRNFNYSLAWSVNWANSL